MAKKLPVPVTEEEFKQIIKNTYKVKHKLAFLLAFEAGLRVSECVKLKPENINIEGKSILILEAKGKKDRVVPLPKRFKPSYLALLPLNIKVRALQKAFTGAAKRSGIKKIKPTVSFHSLRHGFATRMVNNGCPIHHLRTLLGHSNISTTNVYLEANPKEALKSYEDLF